MIRVSMMYPVTDGATFDLEYDKTPLRRARPVGKDVDDVGPTPLCGSVPKEKVRRTGYAALHQCGNWLPPSGASANSMASTPPS